MIAKNQEHVVKGDRALGNGDIDMLGFQGVATQIERSLVNRGSDDGLVVGIEGAWGSGKSSLLFLIGKEFSKSDNRKFTVINFRPWLVGSRDALITSLFGEILNQLERVAFDAGNAEPKKKAQAEAAKKAINRFITGLSSAGAFIEVIGEASGFTPIKYVGKGFKALGEMANSKPGPYQLSELKDALSEALKSLDHQFIITIDDVDRLEPAEVIEVLRLVRSVVDLPNVVYLLCYDAEILAQAIERATGVRNGKDFLEKIVQLTVMVPKPEPLQLRQWFTEELHTIASVKNDDELSRLKSIINYEGERQLRTPRSVVRALDSIRFLWPSLSDLGADLSDLVWLQLIKEGNSKLYRWIEDYCATAAVVSLGMATTESSENKRFQNELLNSVLDDYFSSDAYRHYFSEQLPGVDVDYSEGSSGFNIFVEVTDNDRDQSIKDRRLASPDHYRLYFALEGPSHALTKANVASVWESSKNGPEQVVMALHRLNGENLPGSLTKMDLLLDRIKGGVDWELSEGQSENILIALSQILDDIHRSSPFDPLWIGTLWDRAQDCIPFLLKKLTPGKHDLVVETLFRDGSAIGWLTSLLRRETIAHGLYGNTPRPNFEWILTTSQIESATSIILNRYRNLSVEEFFKIPKPISLLFLWRHAGDEDGPRELIKLSTVSDEGFVRTLEILTDTVISSDRGRYKTLQADTVASFMDFDQAIQRIDDLRKDIHLGSRAELLAKYLEDGRRF